MDRGEPDGAVRHRREPGAVRRRHARTSSRLLARARPPGRAGDLPHPDRRAGARRAARGGHAGARARAPSPTASAACSACARRSSRPAGARDELWIIAEIARRLGADFGPPTAPRRCGTSSARSRPHFAGGMSYARLEALGGIQWPCPDESHPGTPFLHARLWEKPRGGPARAVLGRASTRARSRSRTRSTRSLLTTGPPARVVQHRRADRRLPLAAAPRRDAGPLARGRRRGWASPTATRCASRRGAARSSRRRTSTPALRAGIVFMTLHFPDEVPTNVLTIDAADPKSGTAEFKACAVRVEPRRRRRRAAKEPTRMDIRLHDARADRRGARRRSSACSARRRPRWDGGRARRGTRSCTPPSGGRAQRERRHLLLPALQALQARVGWVSEGGLDYVCERLGIPPAEAWSVATFYALLATTPRPAARRARVRRHRLPRARRGGALRAARAHECGPAHAARRAPTVTIAAGAAPLDALAVPGPVRHGAGRAASTEAGDAAASSALHRPASPPSR